MTVQLRDQLLGFDLIEVFGQMANGNAKTGCHRADPILEGMRMSQSYQVEARPLLRLPDGYYRVLNGVVQGLWRSISGWSSLIDKKD